MPKMTREDGDDRSTVLEWCHRWQRSLVATIVAEAIALVDRIVEDKYYDAWLDDEARMLDDIGPLDLVRADALEKNLLAQLAQERPEDTDPDLASPARRRKRRRVADRGPPTMSWNTSSPTADQTAVASPASTPAMGGEVSQGV